MEWSGFAVAFLLFFVSHSVPVRPPVKPWLVARLGARGFTSAYSILSIGVVAWVIIAARNAPYVQVWPWAPWQAYVPLVAMLLVSLVLCLTLSRPNPFSFGGSKNETFDADKPGLVRLTRHPLLMALALWALAHLVPNGDLAHVILFGTFALFALFGGRIIDRRKRREMGQVWHSLATDVARVPVLDSVRASATWPRVVAAVLLWAGLIVLHPVVFGVSPLP